jgi:aspartyl-tRNA(Asn)/glutamyl-tRNA(Gln) amidotransferase subunit A
VSAAAIAGSDLAYLSAADLARAYRARTITPVDVVEAHLARIERLNRGLNAYISVASRSALAGARRAAREMAAGRDRGALHGIPFAVKDQLTTRGLRTTAGSKALAAWTPSFDATAVARLREAGAILLGKLNMTEFAFGEPRRYPYGMPRNPWNLAHETGGSSSGAGSALAAGMTTIAIGEDTGGSIRQPAAHCSVVGLRPTWGLVSRHGLLPGVWQLDTVGPMARTVLDTALALQAIAGRDPLDPTSTSGAVPDYAASLRDGVRGLRAAIVKELLPGPGLDSDVEASVRTAIEVLRGQGLSVGEVSIPIVRDVWAIYSAFADPEAAMTHGAYLRRRPGRLGPNLRIRLATAMLIPAAIARWGERVGAPAVRRQILQALEAYDVLLTPAVPAPARPIRALPYSSPTKDQIMQTQIADRAYRGTFAFAGVPSLAIPCGFTSAGLPCSLQIVGRPLRDDVVLRVGYAYEQATPWHTRRPALDPAAPPPAATTPSGAASRGRRGRRRPPASLGTQAASATRRRPARSRAARPGGTRGGRRRA